MTEPGWYQDPAAPFMVRWWDGQGWTNEVRPGGGGPPDPTADLAAETKAGRWASWALWGGAAGYTAEYFVNALLVGSVWRAVRRWVDMPLRSDGTRPPLVLPHRAAVLNLVSPLLSIGLLGAGVVFLLWFEKAATLAARAGLPARRSVGWAIGGWFVPIVNFWFPYQSALDFFPPGHPGRQTVKRWWTLWLGTSVAGLLVAGASFVSTAAGLTAAAIASAVAFAAAWAGRAVIDEVDRVHAGLLGR